MTATLTDVSRLITRIENLGHKLYVDNFFSSPDLFCDLCVKAINCYGTVWKTEKEFLGTLEGSSD
jgi:hypothetical protein